MNPWYEDHLAWRDFDDHMQAEWLRRQAVLVTGMEAHLRRYCIFARTFITLHAWALG